MKLLIEILLALSAVYCGGAWLLVVAHARALQRRGALYDVVQVENDTFHLGLCFILALGFLLLGA